MTTRGIMADNMFLSQSSLLGWLNSTLMLKLEKIEETCTGAVACQLMDVLHPGSVNIRKVDFNVRSDWEFVGMYAKLWEEPSMICCLIDDFLIFSDCIIAHADMGGIDGNYKELQQAFNKVGIDRAFSVAQLSKGKRQDNNEFMQWFKGYWDSVTGGQDIASEYDAVGRRQMCKTGDWKKFSVGAGAPRPAATSTRPLDTIPAYRRGTTPSMGGVNATRGPASATKSTSASRSHPAIVTKPMVSPELEARVAELEEHVTELKLKVETAERERDFYFDKLRDIEIMCQAPELAQHPILKTVEKVLYAADATEAKVVMAEAQHQYGAQLLSPEEEAEIMASGEISSMPPVTTQ